MSCCVVFIMCMLCCIFIVYIVLYLYIAIHVCCMCCISHSGKEERLQAIARSLNHKSINQSIKQCPMHLNQHYCDLLLYFNLVVF